MLSLRDDRPNLVFLQPRRPDRQRLGLADELIGDRLVQRRMHEHPRGRAAGLTLPVHVHALDRRRCGLLRIGIRENDDRIFAAELEAHALEAGGSLTRDGAPGRHRTDEADALHVGMAHKRSARRSIAGDDVDCAGRKDAFAQLTQPQARQRSLFRALDHDAVAGGERSRGFFGTETEGVIEWIDLADDTVGLPPRKVKMARTLRGGLALDLGDEPGEIAQRVCRPDHVTVHPGDGVAGIDRVHQRQLAGMLLDPLGQQHQAARALLDRNAAPFAQPRLGRMDGAVDVGFGRKRNLAELVHVRGVDGDEASVLGRRDPLAADIEAARVEIERWGVHAPACCGTIAARSTLRSDAFLKAMPRSFSANFESTMSRKGNRLRFAITKSSA